VSGLTEQLIKTASRASEYLDTDSRKGVLRFVKSKWNRDGGVCGRDRRSDLYYTVFGALCLKALKGRIPVFRLFFFLRGFGAGKEQDAVHLFSLIRLRSYFPMSGKLKRDFADAVEKLDAGSAYDSFFKAVTSEYLGHDGLPSEPFRIHAADPTTNLAAAVVVNDRPDAEAAAILMRRYCRTGGFSIGEGIEVPDLLSTATALFALKTLGFDMDCIREPCFAFIESLWRDSGGFAGHEADRFEDVEYTYYALLSIGCLMSET
jgi:prenyltransferase beta subunit